MRDGQRVQLGQALLAEVSRCQRELAACFDLLVELDDAVIVEAEPVLFDAHRALEGLAALARGLTFPRPCRLLVGPSRGNPAPKVPAADHPYRRFDLRGSPGKG